MNDRENTIEFWDDVASEYDSLYINDNESYSPLYYRFKIIKKILSENFVGRVFDAGCGNGKILEYLNSQNIDCVGCDISPEMVQKAKNKNKNILIYNTSLDNLEMIKSNSFDTVICLGVFTYINNKFESKSYNEINRILKIGGVFISAHQNELFNLFALNGYTVDFYSNFIKLFEKQIDSKIYCDILTNIKKLIANEEKEAIPRNINEKKSTRNVIFRREENPLCFGDKLRIHGFESTDYYYYNFHAMPPIYNNSDRYKEISKSLELFGAQSWQAMFMCSGFVNVAIKVTNSLKR